MPQAAVVHLHNFPNPFNPSTEIMFSLTAKDAEDAKIEIFNTKGQKVKQLRIGNEELPITKGDLRQYSITWDGTNSSHQPVASGLYFYQLKLHGKTAALSKMMVIK
jgi:flagellar hook assembly protein FlgD